MACRCNTQTGRGCRIDREGRDLRIFVCSDRVNYKKKTREHPLHYCITVNCQPVLFTR